MPTAVIAFRVPTGFVIAADGRSCAPDLSIKSDTAQKIFSLASSDYDLAFAVMGTAEIAAQGGDGLNLVNEIPRFAGLQDPLRSRNLAGFMTRVCRSFNHALRQMKESGRIAAYPDYSPGEPDRPGITISTVLVCGYFRGYPEMVEARLFHKNQTLCDADIIHIDNERIHGSSILGERIESKDPRFAKYYVHAPSYNPSVAQVIEYSKNYIEAHADPAALDLDPKICKAIGGHIHIATLSASEGFAWVPGFEPISD
jgi:hypothetical protein